MSQKETLSVGGKNEFHFWKSEGAKLQRLNSK